MPEIVTKYPAVLIKELKDAGGKCGVGARVQILKNCPSDQFCVLPTGEICVYDLKDITSMTQISSSEWREAVTGIPGMFSYYNLIILVFILGIGIVIGMQLMTKRNTS